MKNIFRRQIIFIFFLHLQVTGSTIIFYAYGREIRVHGFLQREVREMKRMVEER